LSRTPKALFDKGLDLLPLIVGQSLRVCLQSS
jgi:hypothetical protein